MNFIDTVSYVLGVSMLVFLAFTTAAVLIGLAVDRVAKKYELSKEFIVFVIERKSKEKQTIAINAPTAAVIWMKDSLEFRSLSRHKIIIGENKAKNVCHVWKVTYIKDAKDGRYCETKGEHLYPWAACIEAMEDCDGNK